MISFNIDILLVAINFAAYNAIVSYALHGWVAAWLRWMFQRELRHMLFASRFVPASWRGPQSKEDIGLMSTEEFDTFLAIESDAPEFIRGVFGCPQCMSAWVSGMGALLHVVASIPLWREHAFSVIAASPLVWACGAWYGYNAFHKASSNSH